MAAAIPAVLGVFSAVQQYKAGKKADKLAEANAQAAEAETEEEIRRQALADKQQEGLALAKSAAGGSKVTGTVSSYLDTLKNENLANIDWMRRSGSSQADLERKKGAVAKSQATAGAIGSLAGAAGSGYSAGQSQGWWS